MNFLSLRYAEGPDDLTDSWGDMVVGYLTKR